MTADYHLLDAGDGERLERFGPHVLMRPAAGAVWPRQDPALWSGVDASFTRQASGKGRWHGPRRPGADWPVEIAGLTLELRLGAFGNLGLFPEQQPSWRWVADRVRRHGSGFELLNGFAYTGAMSLVAARAGARVAHVDAVKQTVDWARRNAELSDLGQATVRWLVDDIVRFIGREQRRGQRYHGVVLDPPTYGRGGGKSRWQIETGLADLIRQAAELLHPDSAFLLLTCHTPGLGPASLANVLAPLTQARGGQISSGELLLPSVAGLPLPSGALACWQSDDGPGPLVPRGIGPSDKSAAEDAEPRRRGPKESRQESL